VGLFIALKRRTFRGTHGPVLEGGQASEAKRGAVGERGPGGGGENSALGKRAEVASPICSFLPTPRPSTPTAINSFHIYLNHPSFSYPLLAWL